MSQGSTSMSRGHMQRAPFSASCPSVCADAHALQLTPLTAWSEIWEGSKACLSPLSVPLRANGLVLIRARWVVLLLQRLRTCKQRPISGIGVRGHGVLVQLRRPQSSFIRNRDGSGGSESCMERVLWLARRGDRPPEVETNCWLNTWRHQSSVVGCGL